MVQGFLNPKDDGLYPIFFPLSKFSKQKIKKNCAQFLSSTSVHTHV